MNHLECVTAQRNQWYWYLLILFLSFLISNTLGTIPYMAVLVWNILRSGGLQNMSETLSGGNLSFLTEGIDSNLMLFVMLFAFVILLVAGAYLIQQLQGRTWRMVVNGTQRVRWSHFFGGFAVWGVINVISMAVGYMTDPGNFEFRFDTARFIPLVLVAVMTATASCPSQRLPCHQMRTRMPGMSAAATCSMTRRSGGAVCR